MSCLPVPDQLRPLRQEACAQAVALRSSYAIFTRSPLNMPAATNIWAIAPIGEYVHGSAAAIHACAAGYSAEDWTTTKRPAPWADRLSFHEAGFAVRPRLRSRRCGWRRLGWRRRRRRRRRRLAVMLAFDELLEGLVHVFFQLGDQLILRNSFFPARFQTATCLAARPKSALAG